MSEFLIEQYVDKPSHGLSHCGPNPVWVRVTHIPTQQSVTAYGNVGHRVRQRAEMLMDMLIQDGDLEACQFPEAALAKGGGDE